MKNNAQSNLIMLAIAAVILVVVNVAAWGVAEEGSIGNIPLWGAFVVLNVASVLWATSLLGLHPLGVALSYVVGGALAFLGTKGADGISVSEVMTAGATYGAFGALAMGNLTTKVRLVFYQKKQIPFIFILVGLLVLDAILNSSISHAGGSVLLWAVVLPFVVAGAGVGFVWSFLNAKISAEKDSRATSSSVATPSKKSSKTPKKKVVPAKKKATPVTPPAKAPVVAQKKAPMVAKVAPVVAEKKVPVVPPPVVEKKTPVVAPTPVIEKKDPVVVPEAPVVAKKETPKEEFNPFGSDGVLKKESSSENSSSKDDSFSMASFFSDGLPDTDLKSSVSAKESVVSSIVETEKESVVPAAASKPLEKAASEGKDDDWLTDHLSMLDKL